MKISDLVIVGLIELSFLLFFCSIVGLFVQFLGGCR